MTSALLLGVLALQGQSGTVSVIIPRITPVPGCAREEDSAEIVVCGRRSDDQRYRIPPAFRGRGSDPRDRAWGSAATDLFDDERAGAEMIGPNGFLEHGRRAEKEWRDQRGALGAEKRDLERAIEEAGPN